MNDIDQMILAMKMREKEIDALIKEMDSVLAKAHWQADNICLDLRDNLERGLIIFVIVLGLYIGYTMSHLTWN